MSHEKVVYMKSIIILRYLVFEKQNKYYWLLAHQNPKFYSVISIKCAQSILLYSEFFYLKVAWWNASIWYNFYHKDKWFNSNGIFHIYIFHLIVFLLSSYNKFCLTSTDKFKCMVSRWTFSFSLKFFIFYLAHNLHILKF